MKDKGLPSREAMLTTAKLFVCPKHPDRSLNGVCFTDRTFGCAQCMIEKPPNYLIHPVRSSTSAVELVKTCFLKFCCPIHPEEEMHFFCLKHNTSVCEKCHPDCRFEGHDLQEFRTVYEQKSQEVKKLKKLLKFYQHNFLSLVEASLESFEQKNMKRLEGDAAGQTKLLNSIEESCSAIKLLRKGDVERLESNLSDAERSEEITMIQICVRHGFKEHISELRDTTNSSVIMLAKISEAKTRASLLMDEESVDAGYLLQRGDSLDDEREFEQAIEYYDKIIKIYPNYTVAYNNKGASLDELGRYEEAIECYNKAIELYPNYPAAYNNKGSALKNMKRYTEAIECYDQVLALDPNAAVAYNNKGFALRSLNKVREAVECYEKALKLDPKYTTAENNKKIALVLLDERKKLVA